MGNKTKLTLKSMLKLCVIWKQKCSLSVSEFDLLFSRSSLHRCVSMICRKVFSELERERKFSRKILGLFSIACNRRDWDLTKEAVGWWMREWIAYLLRQLEQLMSDSWAWLLLTSRWTCCWIANWQYRAFAPRTSPENSARTYQFHPHSTIHQHLRNHYSPFPFVPSDKARAFLLAEYTSSYRATHINVPRTARKTIWKTTAELIR